MTGIDLDFIAGLDDVIATFRTLVEDETRKIICLGCFLGIFRGFWLIAQHINTTRCIDSLPAEMLQKLRKKIGWHYSFQQPFQEPHGGTTAARTPRRTRRAMRACTHGKDSSTLTIRRWTIPTAKSPWCGGCGFPANWSRPHVVGAE